MPIAMRTASAPRVLRTKYLIAASTAIPPSMRNAIRPAEAIERISRKTKKLKMSPVETIPRMPVTIRRKSV